jgi:hypothetical protein
MVRSIAPYDLMAALLASEAPPARLVERALSAPPRLWERTLVVEACAVQFDRALRASPVANSAPLALRELLSDATAQAVRQGLAVPGQISEIAAVARECGIRVMVLKGAARLLDGGIPGGRAMADIDLLAPASDARRLHAALTHHLAYAPMSASPEHHLPTLTRPGGLPVEVHVRLGPRPTPLDTRIWRDVREVSGTDLVIPSPTAALLHALEHGALVHWAVRYRLRDLLDVAESWTAAVDGHEVSTYADAHSHRGALMTILGGARRFAAAIPVGRAAAWRTVRRVACARHLVTAHVRDPARAKSLCIAAGVLAEGSPRALLRPAQLALFGVEQAGVGPMTSLEGQPGAA